MAGIIHVRNKINLEYIYIYKMFLIDDNAAAPPSTQVATIASHYIPQYVNGRYLNWRSPPARAWTTRTVYSASPTRSASQNPPWYSNWYIWSPRLPVSNMNTNLSCIVVMFPVNLLLKVFTVFTIWWCRNIIVKNTESGDWFPHLFISSPAPNGKKYSSATNRWESPNYCSPP